MGRILVLLLGASYEIYRLAPSGGFDVLPRRGVPGCGLTIERRRAKSANHALGTDEPRTVHEFELEALGIDLVVLDQAIDTSTPSGRLLFHVLGCIAEFERDLIRERTAAGMRAARRRGAKMGRPNASVDRVALVRGLRAGW